MQNGSTSASRPQQLPHFACRSPPVIGVLADHSGYTCGSGFALVRGMTFDELHRPDRKLLQRLSSKRRAAAPLRAPAPAPVRAAASVRAPAPAPVRAPAPARPAVAVPTKAAVPAAASLWRAPTPQPRSGKSNFFTDVPTCPGMGKQVSASIRDGDYVNPWREHRPVPALPPGTRKTRRAARGSAVQSPKQLRSQNFTAAEIDFFTAGDELAEEYTKEESECVQEIKLRWWQRLTRQ